LIIFFFFLIKTFISNKGCDSQKIYVSNNTRSKEASLQIASDHQTSNQNNNHMIHNDAPKILTKSLYVTSYEHHTVTIPCEILNLPVDMHVIWQYGKRGEANQTVLTIGGTQLETNYRVRVVLNTTEYDRKQHETFYNSNNSSNDAIFEPKPGSRLTINNLEIRKLQLSDSGWYECQLPTKPTQINYVYLEVLSKFVIST
jgi:hypothetical protein